GDEAQADETIRIDGAVLLGQKVVVGPDDGLIGVVVFDAAPHAGAGDAGEEHLGVDPVDVLLLQPLLWRPGPRGRLVVLRKRDVGLERLAAVQVRRHLPQRLPLDYPGVTAIGQANDSWRAVA